MKISLTPRSRTLVVFACVVLAVIGFMLKLPSVFRHIDKELHATFYFGAALFFNVLFVTTKLLKHVLIFIALYVFGIFIELGQAYSNRFFTKRIHGRFDPEDVQSNLKGLLAFSLLWVCYAALIWIYKRARLKRTT